MTIKKHIVISGVNLVEGGTLTIYKECLDQLAKNHSRDFNITALVHSANLFETPGINYIEYPEIKKSWLKRVFFEYFHSKKISKDLKADIWFSIHDLSPSVLSKKRMVYCHNAMCFYDISWKEFILEPKLFIFSIAYKLFYRININKNNYVIVQQNWIKENFEKKFNAKNVIVAYPYSKNKKSNVALKNSGNKFIYPSLPRAFKNFETLLKAWEILEEDPSWDGELLITIDGSENKYSNKIFSQYGHLKRVNFTGRLSLADVHREYNNRDCLIFPSKLETWGLPLSEVQDYGLAVIAADLPYAKESLSGYKNKSYFQANNCKELAEKIKLFRLGELPLEADTQNIYSPEITSWDELFNIIIK
ncbi:glycosyltransferase [Comamonas thiooxydans]|uniref:glycosyltransferase n=1 Tax=Comamonas thiooxydans TaxID=363952 RepID=UPI0009B8D376|nr:glycosyltransferase [Comamonas thiooxydans]